MKRLGIDTGGTFTDVVAEDGSCLKVPSDPGDPAKAILKALSRMMRLLLRPEHRAFVVRNRCGHRSELIRRSSLLGDASGDRCMREKSTPSASQ